jgi:hypothetical protein
MSTLTYVGWMSTSRREVSKYLQYHMLAFDENMSVLRFHGDVLEDFGLFRCDAVIGGEWLSLV